MPQISLTVDVPDDYHRHPSAAYGELYRGTLVDIEEYLRQVLKSADRKEKSADDMAGEIRAIIAYNIRHAITLR